MRIPLPSRLRHPGEIRALYSSKDPRLDPLVFDVT